MARRMVQEVQKTGNTKNTSHLGAAAAAGTGAGLAAGAGSATGSRYEAGGRDQATVPPSHFLKPSPQPSPLAVRAQCAANWGQPPPQA